MQPIKLTENIYWVGGIDWDIRNFHGYLTPRGTTYNAYLILDEQITLIDTVKHYLADQLIARISKLIDPSKIQNIISNHVEMDHSGSLPHILKFAPSATVYTSEPNGLKGLKRHYKQNWNFKSVKSGDKITLGKHSLEFIATPMIHWPDNMVTYCPESKILFSNDAFGQHIASSERFDTEFPKDLLLEEAKKYYANIVLPYGKQVLGVLETVKQIPADTIAPSHGLIYRKHIPEILAHYQKWADNQTENKAVIIFDTMWESTRMIAKTIAAVCEKAGIHYRLMDLKVAHISDVATEVCDAKYIFFGSSTLNNQMLPTIAAALTYLKGLAPKNRTGLAFGSYGWSGQSVGQIEETLKAMGMTLLPQIKIQYIPDESELNAAAAQLEQALNGH